VVVLQKFKGCATSQGIDLNIDRIVRNQSFSEFSGCTDVVWSCIFWIIFGIHAQSENLQNKSSLMNVAPFKLSVCGIAKQINIGSSILYCVQNLKHLYHINDDALYLEVATSHLVMFFTREMTTGSPYFNVP
jgi:hypothetical protein